MISLRPVFSTALSLTTMPKKRAPKPKYQTRRERFLSEMEQVVPWQALLEALEPSYYPNAAGRRGRPPVGLERTCESVPDATTLLKFRRWLEEHELTQTIFKTINARLSDKGQLLFNLSTVRKFSCHAKSLIFGF